MTTQPQGEILSLRICKGHLQPMQSQQSLDIITGFGIEGDRHASEHPARSRRQILLMDKETLDSFGLEQGQIRENITTTGIDLASFPTGQCLALGAQVQLQITGDCEPCVFIENIRPGLRQQIEGRRGMLTRVIQGGTIKIGDTIKAV